MDRIVRAADARKCFEVKSLEEYFISFRSDERLAMCLWEIDKQTCLAFEANFSFALSAPLLRGLQNAKTKTATNALLALLLTLSNKGSVAAPEGLGFLAALLPYRSDAGTRGARAFSSCLTPVCSVGILLDVDGRQQYLWTTDVIVDKKLPVLLVSLWLSLLKVRLRRCARSTWSSSRSLMQHAKGFEAETQFIYQLLDEAVNFDADSLASLHEVLAFV